MVDLSGAILTYSLKSTDNSKIFTVEVSCFDCAAVNEDGRNVQSGNGDHCTRHVLVAAPNCEQTVYSLSLTNGFDRVGDYLTRHEGILHPFRAHRDSVADSDCAESLRHG